MEPAEKAGSGEITIAISRSILSNKCSKAVRHSPDGLAALCRRGFPAAPPLPQEAGAANAVDRYDPTRENAKPERPQTLRLCSIKNILSAIYAQSNAERI